MHSDDAGNVVDGADLHHYMGAMSDDEERQLRMEWLRMQIDKARYDMAAERRRARRETLTIVLTAIGLAVAIFAAGHFIR